MASTDRQARSRQLRNYVIRLHLLVIVVVVVRIT